MCLDGLCVSLLAARMPKEHQRQKTALGLLLGVLSSACGVDTMEPIGTRAERVIYGEDDRRELYELSPIERQATIGRSVAALMWAHRIAYGDGGSVELRANSLGETLGLCQGERFAEQAAAALCSATLIDDDLVLTAGHCLGTSAAEAESRCRGLLVVFDYYMTSQHEMALDSNESVYACRRVVHHEKTSMDGTFADLAMIQLDRPATPAREPAALSRMRPRAGDTILAAAHGAGLPLKVEAEASIAEIADEADFFVAGTDSFGGGSGGSLFNAMLELIGHQVRGLPDWTLDGECTRPAQGDEPSEEHQLVSTSMAALCESGWPSTRLCDRPSSCGDGVCSGHENASDCDSDCDPPSCGDGLCEFSERLDCSEDCHAFSGVPAEWMGDPRDYLELGEEGNTGASRASSADPQEGCSFRQGRHPWKPGALLVCTAIGSLMGLRRRRV
jgi:hypothetical protein